MLDAGIRPEECFRIVHQLAKLGILANDLGLTVRLIRGVRAASASRLEYLSAMEKALIELMAESAPDADQDEAQQHLNLRAVCTELRASSETRTMKRWQLPLKSEPACAQWPMDSAPATTSAA
jgi:ATP-dependent DNA helicase RecQ